MSIAGKKFKGPSVSMADAGYRIQSLIVDRDTSRFSENHPESHAKQYLWAAGRLAAMGRGADTQKTTLYELHSLVMQIYRPAMLRCRSPGEKITNA
jgi:hypothetical protein